MHSDNILITSMCEYLQSVITNWETNQDYINFLGAITIESEHKYIKLISNPDNKIVSVNVRLSIVNELINQIEKWIHSRMADIDRKHKMDDEYAMTHIGHLQSETNVLVNEMNKHFNTPVKNRKLIKHLQNINCLDPFDTRKAKYLPNFRQYSINQTRECHFWHRQTNYFS